MRYWMAFIVAVVLVGVALPVALTSCVPSQVEETRAVIAQIKADMITISAEVATAKADLAEMEAAITAMPEGREKEVATEVAAKVSEGIAASEKWLGKATQATTALELALADAQDGFDVAEAVLNTARDIAPPPWGYLASSLGGLVLGLIRAAYNRSVARKVIRSVDTLVQPDGNRSAIISAAQGAAGKRMVDEAQGKRFALPV